MKLDTNGNYFWTDEQGFHSALPQDYRVVAWLSEGNTPEPADPLPAPLPHGALPANPTIDEWNAVSTVLNMPQLLKGEPK